jgi:hopene-associated glycosyltransferase HpnB
VIVVDDQSGDGTAEAARRAASNVAEGLPISLRVIEGAALPEGWAGKLWALEQGLAAVDRPFVLLLDADIELARAMLPTLLRLARARRAALVSIMAELSCENRWERLLAPPFVFFFKLLYPFALANDPARRTAAAAGGCMLASVADLRAVGAFASIRDALIDDCALAALLKRGGRRIWIGLSRSVVSRRAYAGLGDFWRMVSRSAFTQLRYSASLLITTTAAMVVVFVVGPAALAAAASGAVETPVAVLASMAVVAMAVAYWPTVHFYRLPAIWTLTLPLAAALFLAMTWSSALGYWRGTRATWKNRRYEKTR